MNVFFLDRDPVLAARYMCDKHIPKMVVESAQLLSTAHRLLDGNEIADEKGLYRRTHQNHPSAIWVRQSVPHYAWLHRHFAAKLDEYTLRFGKEHATARLMGILSEPPVNLPDSGWVDPPQAMPDEFKRDDAVDAYRAYYSGDKRRFAKWRNGAPEWWAA